MSCTTRNRQTITLEELALIRADSKLKDLAELQQTASEFCQQFDEWINHQGDAIATSSAFAFGMEYGRLHELLTRLNGGGEMTLPGPLPITDYFDALRDAGLEIVPGSLVWLPDPQKRGRMTAAVAVRVVIEVEKEAENETKTQIT